jgi:hypothetical protein
LSLGSVGNRGELLTFLLRRLVAFLAAFGCGADFGLLLGGGLRCDVRGDELAPDEGFARDDEGLFLGVALGGLR